MWCSTTFRKGMYRENFKAQRIIRRGGFSGDKQPRKTQFPPSSSFPLLLLQLVSNAIRIERQQVAIAR